MGFERDTGIERDFGRQCATTPRDGRRATGDATRKNARRTGERARARSRAGERDDVEATTRRRDDAIGRVL